MMNIHLHAERHPTHMNTSRRNLLGCLALVLTGLLSVPSWAEAPPEKAPQKSKTATETVSLVIDYGNGKEKVLNDIAWRKGMTAWDATLAATQKEPRSQIKHTGSGSKIAVTEIDGFKNQGGSSDKRNWQYWVNGAYADVGVGAKELNAGDKVVWKFTGPPPPGTW